jgi:uncharacterized delta-60 repeat protein
MTARARLALTSLLTACLLAAIVAIAGAAGPNVTESLGVHYEPTGFGSLLARPDGSVVALQGKRIVSFGATGAAGTELAPELKPAEATLYPAAGGKTFVLSYQKLTRLNPDGSIDKSFGTEGTVQPPYSAGAVIELGSGKIAVVSTEVGGTHTVYASVSVEILNQDGSVDEGAGYSSPLDASGVSLGGMISVPEISPTPDGGALAVCQNFLLRLNADGSVDGSFGKGGVVDDLFGQVGGHVLPDGSVETVGMEYGSAVYPVLRRYTSTGKPDSSFGPEGTRRFDFGAGHSVVNAVSWGTDGSVVVGGGLADREPCPAEGCAEAPTLTAFNAAGERETGFGEGGVLRLASLAGHYDGTESGGVTAIVRRPDGSIVAAGSAPPNATTGFLAALTPQGALLPGFGEGGLVRAADERPAELHLAGFAPLPGG